MKKLLLILIVATPYYAIANYSCSGKIIHLGFDGALRVNNGFGVHELCNLSEEKCKAWSGAALAAKMANSSITVYYSGSQVGEQSAAGGQCHNIGNWVTPNDPPYYFQVN